MKITKYIFQLILQIFFVIIFFSTLHSKNVNKFNTGKNISNYFSGILLLGDNEHLSSYEYLKRLDGLEKDYPDYSSNYLHTLVNLGKFREAFNYSKKLEKEGIDNFESNLVIGIFYHKNKDFDLAQKYFLRLKDTKSNFILNDFISNSLINWNSFHNLDLNSAQNRIESIDQKFSNLKKIQSAFLHCFYKSEDTEILFEKLSSNNNLDFSRYNYFFAEYLLSNEKFDKAEKIINSSIEKHPRNILLNQLKLDLDNKKFESVFNCQNQTHIIAELFYITANALSSQSIFKFSNFYLNIAKYLNKEFHSFDTLLAENFYKSNNLKHSKKIYERIGKKGQAYFWYAAKQNVKILIKENQKNKGILNLEKAYNKLIGKNIYQIFEYAEFLKDNNKYLNSIKLYSEIIEEIKIDHPLYPEVTDGRGVAYERIGEWDKAEKDLLSSLNSKPEQAYVINYLAYSWIEQGIKIEESLKMLKKANSIKSNDPYIIDSLGWALFKLKRYKESKNYLQLAVQLMPADPIVNDHYGDVLWKIGNKIQARYYWNYVLDLSKAEKTIKDNIKNKLIFGL